MKLWDVRAMATRADARARLRARPLPVWNWDYRYMGIQSAGGTFGIPTTSLCKPTEGTAWR